MTTPTGQPSGTPQLDTPAILAALQDQIDELTRVVTSQQDTLDSLRQALRGWIAPEP